MKNINSILESLDQEELIKIKEDSKMELIVDDTQESFEKEALSDWLKRAYFRWPKESEMVCYNELKDCWQSMGIRLVKTNQFTEKYFKLPYIPQGKQSVLLLDRDGIINKDSGYIFKKEDLVFRSGIFDLLKEAKRSQKKVIVLTNQSGIGRGYYKEEDVKILHDFIEKELAQKGLEIDGWYYCPYHPESGDPHYKRVSLLRKPMPGMALIAQKDFDLSLKDCFMIGDKKSDRLNELDIPTLFLRGNYDLDGESHVYESFNEIVNYLKVQQFLL